MTSGAEVIERGAPETLKALQEILASGRFVPRPELKPEAIILRSLEVAINAAELEQPTIGRKVHPIDTLQQWERLGNLADKAGDWLRYLLLALAQRDGRTDLGLAQTRLGRGNVVLPRLRRETLHDARTLDRAMSILLLLKADAERRRRTIAAERHNPGTPDKRAFVRVLAEGWTYLFAKPPGRTTNLRNPFLRLVAAAAADWLGREVADRENFGQSLTVALKGLTPIDPSQPPSWL